MNSRSTVVARVGAQPTPLQTTPPAVSGSARYTSCSLHCMQLLQLQAQEHIAVAEFQGHALHQPVPSDDGRDTSRARGREKRVPHALRKRLRLQSSTRAHVYSWHKLRA